jgi:hypothetical protein
LIDNFANKPITFTLIESLPKEKTAVLGSAEIFLYAEVFKIFRRTQNQSNATPEEEGPFSIKASLPIQYSNPKLLPIAPTQVPSGNPPSAQNPQNTVAIPTNSAPGGGQSKGDPEEAPRTIPELEVEIVLSKPLIPQEVMELGNFIIFKPEDMLPLPEEWSLKEGNEKDINSSKCNACIG